MNAPLTHAAAAAGSGQAARFAGLGAAVARIGPVARRWRGRLGRSGIAALMLLCASAIGAATLVRAALADIAAAQAQLAAAQRAGPAAAPQHGASADAADAFERRFPPETAFPDALGQLVRCAERHGLVLDDGDYKVSRDAAGRLVRYRLALPFRGSYPQLRLFLAELLAENAAAAVANVQLSRAKVGEPAVETRLELVFFLRRTQ